MANIGMNTSTPLPALLPGAATLSATSPLGAQNGLSSGVLSAAQAGAAEKPGIGTRLVSAMKAAISELRGQGATDAQLRSEILAMQAQAPVTLAKKPSVAKPAVAGKQPSGKSFTDGAGNVRQVGTGKILKPATRPAAAAAGTTTAAAAAPTLPANATQLPGATVYSYDADGNPVVAGAQGTPTMQQQLGLTPTMLQGYEGLAQAADPSGPQVNATNQTNLSGLGNGLGAGTAVPVLGQPILNVPTTSPGDAAGAAAAGSTPANQVVRNSNTTDIASRNQGLAGWGTGLWGDPTGGIATPYSPYGASMTGAYTLGGTQNQGFFSKLFG